MDKDIYEVCTKTAFETLLMMKLRRQEQINRTLADLISKNVIITGEEIERLYKIDMLVERFVKEIMTPDKESNIKYELSKLLKDIT